MEAGTPPDEDIMSRPASGFPAEKLLDHLGPSVARLILLKRFSQGDAVRFSDGQFEDVRLTRYIDVVFVEDPVTNEITVRPELDELCLRAMGASRSRAPEELARLLITTLVGDEVLEADEFLRWMLRQRFDPLVQATVVGMAACAALEIAPTVESLLSGSNLLPGIASTLLPYVVPARRWELAAYPSSGEYAGERMVEVFSQLPSSLTARSRRARSVVVLSDGVLPQTFKLTRPRRTQDTVQLALTPEPIAELPSSTHLVQLPGSGTGENTLTSKVTLSESTIDLLRLVMSNRGPAQVTDRIHINVSRRTVERMASVSITDMTTIGDTAFIHLGTLPRSLGNALKREALAEGEQLTWGGGPVVTRYLQEVTKLLTDLAARNPAAARISASDWYRVERSVREPWRFISTNRTYINLAVVELSWTTPLSDDDIARPREPWPFEGASMSRIIVEGFRCGSDDGYNVDVQCGDTSAIVSASIDSVTRSFDVPALERPSRIRTYLTWPVAVYLTVLAVVILCASVLLTVGFQGQRAAYLSYSDINITLSVASLVTGPVVAYLTASQFKKERNRIPYLRQSVSAAGVVALTVVLTFATLLAPRYMMLRDTLIIADLIAGCYLAIAVIFSLFSRLARSASMRNHVMRSASAARESRRW